MCSINGTSETVGVAKNIDKIKIFKGVVSLVGVAFCIKAIEQRH